MANLANQNPTGRFTGLAELYARCRPGYPDTAIDFILTHCGLGPASTLADFGSGTGISARIFARRGIAVIGIEPNADMRAQAEQEPTPAEFPQPSYRAGTAEATGLPACSADAVLAAQAFHWFEPEGTLREFHRILKPGGWVILIWNERDEADAFTASYGEVIRSAAEAAVLESVRAQAGEVLLGSPLFRNARKVCFRHAQELDADGAVGRAFSMSYAPKEPAAAEQHAAALRQVFERFQQSGKATLCYLTTVYVGQKPSDDHP